MAELVGAGHRTIAFCRSRAGTEVVAADARRRLPPRPADAVRPYRGGYLAAERREIEDELFGGRLDGVVATTALELGVDIGGLDACVLDGFPGTIASMWQQAGRAGRRAQASLAVLVAGDDQLDQWLMATRRAVPPAARAGGDQPRQPVRARPPPACAAYELPLTHADERWWPDCSTTASAPGSCATRSSCASGPAAGAAGASCRAAGGRPTASGCAVGARRRGAASRTTDGTLVGTVDEARAFELVHPGAIYLHQGQT